MPDESERITKEDYEALATFRYHLRQFVRFSEEGARMLGITPQQHQAMLAVKGQREREWASIGEIAHFLQIQPHAAVGLVNRCVQAGLLDRGADPDDRRGVRVTLTEKGADVLAQLSERNMRELRTLQEALSLDWTAAVGILKPNGGE